MTIEPPASFLLIAEPFGARPPATEPSSAFVAFLLAQFRCAELRARIVANELRATAVALSAGLISAETALLHLHETGAVESQHHLGKRGDNDK